MNDQKTWEEQKRLRCADPDHVWTIFEQTIDWLDAQQPIPRASKEGCLRAQRKFDKAPTSASE